MRFETSTTLEEQIKLLATELERTRSELRTLRRQHRQGNLAKRMTYLAGFVVLALMISDTLTPRSIAQKEVARSTTILDAPGLGLRAAASLPAAEDILERSRAKYASLKSYSDTGTVTTEYRGPGATGSSLVEHHTFTTYYRAPRHFFFEFRKNPKESKERYVIWCPDGEDFQAWWSATGNTAHHGRNPNVFALASYPTKGSALQIPSLLFPKAEMQGPISGLKEYRLAETEDVNGRSCYKLVGELALAYKTGAVTEAHPTTIWIDAETLLVRKVFEDSSTSGSVSTTTTTFEPQANPTLDESRFKFTPPI